MKQHSILLSLTAIGCGLSNVAGSARGRGAASSTHHVSFFTRLGLAYCLAVSFLVPAAHGANTFANTGPLVTVRSVHTATLLHNGKVLVAGGQGSGGALTNAETYEPATGAWSGTGALATARYLHTATLLPNGKVLVVGGINSGNAVASAEIYDPATGLWTATGGLRTARQGHTATLLPNGRVLVAGGHDGSTLASAELYDPATGTWTATTNNLATARVAHTATLLPNGKVLVAGGINGGGTVASTELYDPATGTWSATGALAAARYLHTATLLPNGKVLVAGGSDNTGHLASAELYDPAGNGGAGSWSPTGAFATARYRHTATLLPNGKVLVAGGATTGGAYLTSAELYDPATGTWTATGVLATGRFAHTATLLPNGRVLVAAGYNDSTYLASTELYDSASGSWSATGALVTARSDHTATLLPNGKVLVAGGQVFSAVASAETYDPSTGVWSATGSLGTARYLHTATLLPNGKVLVAGGINGGGFVASAELYDPATGTWSATGALAIGREFHTATLLASGKVLVAGGYNGASNGSGIASAELYDPTTGAWSAAGAFEIGLYNHTATLLPDGKVFVVGGQYDETFGTRRPQVYDPATGIWSRGAEHTWARFAHTATLLPNGRVLVSGGLARVGDIGNPTVVRSSVEIYDPVAGTWSDTGSLGAERFLHTATLLPNGKVLVAGGGSLASAELYDPATGTWSATQSFATRRHSHTATLLQNGTVLIAGGNSGTNPSVGTAELYDVGLGFSAAWQPQISSAAFDADSRLMLTGTGFRGISSASGGNGGQNSPTDYPAVQLRRLDNEQSVFLLPDPAAAVSATGFTSAPVAPFSGHAIVTVFANGIPSTAFPIAFPDITVEQPIGTSIADGGTQSFGPMVAGSPVSLLFTIKNPNPFNLTGLTITKDGANAADFTVTASPTAPVPPGGSTTFTIEFAPTTSGTKTAAIHIANNVAVKNPYDINLTGQAVSFTTDTDGDGMNDASEFQMATLGFNWQVSQPALVNALFANANGAGLYDQMQYDSNRTAGRNDVINDPNPYSLYTLPQVQALNVGVPLLTKDAAAGRFKLTIGVQKSTDLLNFNPFPMTAPQTLINGQGKLEFLFTVPDNAAFFRLQSQ